MPSPAESQAFEDHAEIIRSIAKSFSRRYGLNSEDVESEANYQFLEAYRKHNGARGTLTNRIRYHVRTRLTDLVRVRCRQHASLPRTDAVLTAVPSHRWAGTTFDRESFVRGLSDDATAVVTLLWDESDTPLNRSIRSLAKPTPAAVRKALSNHLRHEGWTTDRVNDAFQEIHDATSTLEAS